MEEEEEERQRVFDVEGNETRLAEGSGDGTVGDIIGAVAGDGTDDEIRAVSGDGTDVVAVGDDVNNAAESVFETETAGKKDVFTESLLVSLKRNVFPSLFFSKLSNVDICCCTEWSKGL